MRIIESYQEPNSVKVLDCNERRIYPHDIVKLISLPPIYESMDNADEDGMFHTFLNCYGIVCYEENQRDDDHYDFYWIDKEGLIVVDFIRIVGKVIFRNKIAIRGDNSLRVDFNKNLYSVFAVTQFPINESSYRFDTEVEIMNYNYIKDILELDY